MIRTIGWSRLVMYTISNTSPSSLGFSATDLTWKLRNIARVVFELYSLYYQTEEKDSEQELAPPPSPY